MKLYDQIFNVVKDFRKFFSPGPVTNADVSGSITSEILLIVSFLKEKLPWKKRKDLELIKL